MKFSIITCTWNSAATLPETIASVQSQRGAEFEHIFVDGGSTDATLDQIASMAPGATVLRDVRGGISRAMNEGIKAARGDVVAHLHSDDYFSDDQVLASVAQGLSGGAKWLVGRIDRLRDGELLPMPAQLPVLSRRSFYQGSAAIPHPATFIKRVVFEEHGMFDESLRYAMDIDLWMRLLPWYTPVQLDRVLTVFREHEGSVSTANVLSARKEELMVRRRYAHAHPLDTFIFWLRYMRRVQRLRQALDTKARAAS